MGRGRDEHTGSLARHLVTAKDTIGHALAKRRVRSGHLNAQVTQQQRAETHTRTARWADVAVLPLVLSISILPLLWFARNWRVPPDGSMYLLSGWNLISGRGYNAFGDVPQTVRGPVFPGSIGALMLVFGRDVHSLAMAVRLVTLLHPVVMCWLVKRVTGPWQGLLSAALVAAFGYTARLPAAFTIDGILLIVYLLSVVVLLLAIEKNGGGLALASGALLGAAILTKETSFTGLPLAVVASLLLPWSVRGVLLHYAGVSLTCLPWWIWVWHASGGLYLVGRLPSTLVFPAVAALTGLALLAFVLFRTGLFAWALRDERRRLATAGVIVFGWTVVLSALLLSTVGGRVFRDTPLWDYIVRRVLDGTPLWYLLPLGGAYALVMAMRGHRLWALYIVLLVFQAPISLLVLTQRYAIRQWMGPQTLLYGALASMLVALFQALRSREEARGRRGVAGRLIAGLLVAALAVSSVVQTRSLLTEDERYAPRDPNNQVNQAELQMSRWIQRNVPGRDTILSTWLYSAQLAFQDGGQHRWIFMQADCVTRARQPEDAACARDTSRTRHWPPAPETAWLQMVPGCDATAFRMTDLLQQMKDADARYLLVTRGPRYPAVLAWAPQLVRSGSFEVVHSAYLSRGPTVESARGLVLLTRTGRPPKPQPTLMDVDAVMYLIQCEQSVHGERYARAIRATFPRGISVFGGGPEVGTARSRIREIYEKDE